MKITVLTGKDGEVLATVSQPKDPPKGSPKFGITARQPGHKVHEIEMPDHMEKIEPVEEFHRQLKEHLSRTMTR